MQCGHCAGKVRVYEFQKKSKRNECVTCESCGSSHTFQDGTVSVINPRPMPTGQGAIVMPWRSSEYRPIDPGIYECRFRELDAVLRLQWDGRNFLHEGQRVQMRTFMAWRGSWAA